MKKICIVFNHLQVSDGVCQSAIGIANAIAESKEDAEVTLRPLYTWDKKMLERINPKVKVEPVFKRYFHGLNKLVDLIPDRMLYKRVIKEKYDIEIGFCATMPTKIIAASTNKDAKHFVWVHTYKEYTKYYKKFDKVVSVAKNNVELLKRDLENKIDVDFCHNPIDDRKIVDGGLKEIEENVPNLPLFVSVGRHSHEKGYDRLLNVVKTLKDEGYKFKVWLIGDGPISEELKAQANDLGVLDMVDFLGRKYNPHAYTAKSDLFICPSRREGYSTVCTEAIMLGIPVLTTAVSGAKEMIDQAKAGLVVDNSTTAFYNGLKWVLDHPEVSREWKDTLEKTKESFSYQERKKKLFEVLEI